MSDQEEEGAATPQYVTKEAFDSFADRIMAKLDQKPEATKAPAGESAAEVEALKARLAAVEGHVAPLQSSLVDVGLGYLADQKKVPADQRAAVMARAKSFVEKGVTDKPDEAMDWAMRTVEAPKKQGGNQERRDGAAAPDGNADAPPQQTESADDAHDLAVFAKHEI